MAISNNKTWHTCRKHLEKAWMTDCVSHHIWGQLFYTNARSRCGTLREPMCHHSTHREQTRVTLPLSVITTYLNRSSQAILENQLGVNSHDARPENIFNIWCTDNDKWIMREKVRSTLSPSQCALWETEAANLIHVKSERNDTFNIEKDL